MGMVGAVGWATWSPSLPPRSSYVTCSWQGWCCCTLSSPNTSLNLVFMSYCIPHMAAATFSTHTCRGCFLARPPYLHCAQLYLCPLVVARWLHVTLPWIVTLLPGDGRVAVAASPCSMLPFCGITWPWACSIVPMPNSRPTIPT